MPSLDPWVMVTKSPTAISAEIGALRESVVVSNTV